MEVKKIFFLTYFCCSISYASGIPTVDIVGNAQSLTQSLQEIQQLKEQLQQAKEQYTELKSQGETYKKMVEGNWDGLGDYLLNTDVTNIIPNADNTINSAINSTSNNAKSLLSSFDIDYDTSSDSDKNLSSTKKINTAANIVALKKMQTVYTKNLENLKSLKTKLETATTPFQKTDLQNAIGLQQAEISNQKMQQEIYLKSLNEANNLKEAKVVQKKMEQLFPTSTASYDYSSLEN